jgi:hypothetical protein
MVELMVEIIKGNKQAITIDYDDGTKEMAVGDRNLISMLVDYAETNGYAYTISDLVEWESEPTCNLCATPTRNEDGVCDDDECRAQFDEIKWGDVQ